MIFFKIVFVAFIFLFFKTLWIATVIHHMVFFVMIFLKLSLSILLF